MRNISRPTNRSGMVLPATLIDEMVMLCNTEQWEELEIRAHSVTKRHPRQIIGWRALGKALLKLEKWKQAKKALSKVVKLSPGDADACNDLGYVFNNLGQKVEAEASYRRALQSNPLFAIAYSNLGTFLADQNRLTEATEFLKQSITINPNAVEPHINLGRVLRENGRLHEAEASCRRALELNPNFFQAYVNLGLTLKDLGQLEEAQASYRHALEINPNSDFVLHSLGILLAYVGGKEIEALACLERSIAINPDNADVYNTLGNFLLHTGQVATSMAMFRHAQELRPLITQLAKKEKADFSVVLLDAPGPSCTPVSYLVGKAPYDCHFYCVLPDVPFNLDILRAKADVVVNIIADADNGMGILPFALDLVERLDRPTVNHPRLIMDTDRETVARRLAGISLCHIPKTKRLTGAVLAEAAANNILAGFTMPLLVRLAGYHGGDDFEKFFDLNAITEFVSKRLEADYYLSEYVDYRSSDGFFRKYRLIYIDGELLPYHLAIHDDWKVHHFRTDMDNQAWMRQEEEAFLKNPHLVFDELHQAALRAVTATIGLNYSGIDCALDCDGKILVFETNAAMLVHDEKEEIFAYKNPYIAKIKDAFNAMLIRMATSS